MNSNDTLTVEAKFTNCSTNDHQSSNPMKRNWSSESLTNTGSAMKTCCCAPTTHAGSFRCRLHRLPSIHVQAAPLPPPAPSSMSTTTASRTVEAQ